MKDRGKRQWILIAEDDPDDRLLISEAFKKNDIPCELTYVENGDSLIACLREERNGKADAPVFLPDLILLDLNMPGKDGRQVLKEIKADKHLKAIPIVVLTTSRSEEDIIYSYQTGANSYITKPDSFEALVITVKTLTTYWFESILLPHHQPVSSK